LRQLRELVVGLVALIRGRSVHLLVHLDQFGVLLAAALL
jgi:hypothetical protein